MHHMETNETHWEKARWEQHKNATCFFEQILEVTPHKTLAVQPITSHLANSPIKTNKICGALPEKEGRTHKRRSPMDVLALLSVETLDVVWKTCRERSLIGTDGERENQGTPDCQRDLRMRTEWLAKELSAAARIMQSSSKELSTLVADRV